MKLCNPKEPFYKVTIKETCPFETHLTYSLLIVLNCDLFVLGRTILRIDPYFTFDVCCGVSVATLCEHSICVVL